MPRLFSKHRKRFGRKGEAGTSIMSGELMYVVIGIIILIVIVIIGTRFLGMFMNKGEGQHTIANFQTLGLMIQELAEDGKDFSVIKGHPYFIGKDYLLVGFDKEWNNQFGADYMGDENFKKPNQCKNKACLCLYKRGYFGEKSSEIQGDCFLLDDDVAFISAVRGTTADLSGPQKDDFYQPFYRHDCCIGKEDKEKKSKQCFCAVASGLDRYDLPGGLWNNYYPPAYHYDGSGEIITRKHYESLFIYGSPLATEWGLQNLYIEKFVNKDKGKTMLFIDVYTQPEEIGWWDNRYISIYEYLDLGGPNYKISVEEFEQFISEFEQCEGSADPSYELKHDVMLGGTYWFEHIPPSVPEAVPSRMELFTLRLTRELSGDDIGIVRKKDVDACSGVNLPQQYNQGDEILIKKETPTFGPPECCIEPVPVSP